MADRPRRSIAPRRKPLVPWVPPMRSGSRALDGGALTGISREEAGRIAATDPIAARYLRPSVGMDELRNATTSFCIWMEGANLDEIASSSELTARMSAVRGFRAASGRVKEMAAALQPQAFFENRQPASEYLVLPSVASAKWDYIPTLQFGSEVVAKNSVHIVEPVVPTVPGFVESRAYAVWCSKQSSGSGSSRKLGPTSTYNTFPFVALNPEEEAAIAQAYKQVLLARSYTLQGKLDDFADRSKMPAPLRKAHDALDKLVADILGYEESADEGAIFEVLVKRHDELLGTSGPTPATHRKAA